VSDDILDRLRERQKRCKGVRQAGAWQLMRDAIAEIKRLRQEVDHGKLSFTVRPRAALGRESVSDHQYASALQ